MSLTKILPKIEISHSQTHILEFKTTDNLSNKRRKMNRIILIISSFHQLRTYLTFAKVFQPDNIEIVNYYAETGGMAPCHVVSLERTPQRSKRGIVERKCILSLEAHLVSEGCFMAYQDDSS